MPKGRFASTGVVVGQTKRDRRDQRSDQLKGNKVTMGKNVPRQVEGAVGDITVRDVTSVGLRCYIKTNSGWYDINALIATFRINWIDMNLENSWVAHSASNPPKYAKDQNGFVHLRGAVKGASVTGTTYAAVDSNPDTITDSSNGFIDAGFQAGSTITVSGSSEGANNTTHVIASVAAGTLTLTGASSLAADGAGDDWTISVDPAALDITSLPAGCRPNANQYRLATPGILTVPTSVHSHTIIVEIDTDGDIQCKGGTGSRIITTLDGISFFAQQKITSIGAGSTANPNTDQFPGGFPVH